MKWKYLMVGGLICLVAVLSTSCRTSYWEWNGGMTNSTGNHVAPFNPQNQAQPQSGTPVGQTSP
jgi:hypothetical protein